MLRSVGILMLLAFCFLVWADIAPTPGTQDVSVLFENADAVCSCVIDSVRDNGSEFVYIDAARVLRRHAIANVHPVETYKAPTPSESSFEVEYDDGRLAAGQSAIMFLKSTGPSTYVLADPFLGTTPFTLPPKGNKQGLQGLEAALVATARGTSLNDQLNAMKLLEGLQRFSPETISTVASLCDSTNSEIAYAAFAVVLKTGLAEHIRKFSNYIRSNPTDDAPSSVLSIGSELGQVRDGEALAALEELSASRLLSVRIGSMQALRAMKNPAAAPTIVKRLDDRDGYIRYIAVMTLAETFAKFDNYAPNMSLFDRNPEYYVGLWKSWWEQQKTNLAQ
jgi:hypothetical protein